MEAPAGIGSTTSLSTALTEAPTDTDPPVVEQRDLARAFARAHIDFAWRVARRLGLGPEDAEDIAQQAMLIASQKLENVFPGSERAFLFRTVANLASKVHRTRRRHGEVPEDAAGELTDHGANPEELLEQRRARATLDDILRALPHELRAAFVLFEIEGLSQREIAAALGIPTGTAASRLRRAREEFTRIAVLRGVLPGPLERRT